MAVPESSTQAHDVTPPAATTGVLEDRIRALQAERDQLAGALAEARGALRTREELFASVVHDLRNPLGTIVMGATALLQGEPSPDPKAQRIRTVAERIQRQAERMTRQIGNLSDFTEIQAGRLVLDRGSHMAASILGAASELIGPIARERGVGFETQVAELPAIKCDAERVVQTLSNLATTAIKAIPRGGVIEIGARNDAVFYVHDHAEAPNPSAETGMSYTIARGIVEAHGGRIWTAHEPTTGNSVYFSLEPPSALAAANPGA
jgi:signal transduction histidine kinase